MTAFSSSPETAALETGKGVVSNILSGAARQAAGAGDVAEKVSEKFAEWHQYADGVALHALFPLAFTLLILHELYDSNLNSRPFGVRSILLRTGAVVSLVLSYDFVVGLISYAATSQGDWATWDQIMGPLEKGWERRWEDASDGLSFSDIKPLFIWLVFFALASFFGILAYAAALLLSISQGTLLAIALTVGKSCIVASLVPGVGVAKPWAKFVAMLCAWSSIAGAINAVILANPIIAQSGDLFGSTSVHIKFFIRLAGLYLVYAVFTLAVPKITSAIFSGAASFAPGVLGAMGIGMMATSKLASGTLGAVGAVAGGAASVATKVGGAILATGANLAADAIQKRATRTADGGLRAHKAAKPSASSPSSAPTNLPPPSSRPASGPADRPAALAPPTPAARRQARARPPKSPLDRPPVSSNERAADRPPGDERGAVGGRASGSAASHPSPAHAQATIQPERTERPAAAAAPAAGSQQTAVIRRGGGSGSNSEKAQPHSSSSASAASPASSSPPGPQPTRNTVPATPSAMPVATPRTSQSAEPAQPSKQQSHGVIAPSGPQAHVPTSELRRDGQAATTQLIAHPRSHKAPPRGSK